jgi:hypothetical protein
MVFFIFIVVLKYKLTGTEALTRTQVINAMKRALVRVGHFWHEQFAEKRFTKLGFTEYGFKPRTPRFERNKLRFWPGSAGLPLVMKGEWRERVLGASTVSRIRATRDTLTIPLAAPHATRPDQAAEIRTVTRSELGQMKEALVAFVNEELDAEVPAADRNKGILGGRVKTLSFKNFNPVVRRAAA